MVNGKLWGAAVLAIVVILHQYEMYNKRAAYFEKLPRHGLWTCGKFFHVLRKKEIGADIIR